MPAKSLMAAALAEELEARNIASLGQPICEEIIEAIFERAADTCNRLTMSAQEAEDISRRST
jgi:hypothetical protein